MEACRYRCLMLLLLVGLTTGCGLNTAVLQWGANGRKGVLLNYSCGAHPCDAIDPSKPTIVITHGWNPLPNHIRETFGPSGAQALKCRCGDSYNLLSWDWSNVKISPFDDEPFRIGRCQGKMMAAALRARGVEPRCTQIIAHSLGSLVATQAAVCLSDLGPMAQITMLDPPTSLHEEVFCRLRAQQHACVVENYWAPGISGYGSEANHRGVRNCKIGRSRAPLLGIIDISVSNHVHTMLWYYRTMCDPSQSRGFQHSVFRRCCCGRCGGGCNCTAADQQPEYEEVALLETHPEGSAAATSAGSRKR